MQIKLSKALTSNGKPDEFDVKQVKAALNRIGYYTPFDKVGMIGLPDAAMFDGLKSFQRDRGLVATGQIRPDDDTFRVLNAEVVRKPQGQYIWRSVGDGKVRDSHAQLNGTTRNWSDSPDPTEEYNCRCWVELIPVSGDIKAEPLPPPPGNPVPKIPGTDIPDRGIPEQGFPGSRRFDPFKPKPDRNMDPNIIIDPPSIDPHIKIEQIIPRFEDDV